MTIRGAIERLDKGKFAINYKYGKDYWELLIYNKKFDITYEADNKNLSELLSNYLGESVEVNQEFNDTEYYTLDLKIMMNYSNTDNDNFINVELNGYDSDSVEIKNLNELIEILETGATNKVNEERDEQIYQAEIKKDRLKFKPNGVYENWI